MSALKQPDSMMPMQRVMPAVAFRAKSDEVVQLIVGGYRLLATTQDTRMVNVMHDKISCAATNLTGRLVTFKHRRSIAGKTLLFSSSISRLLDGFRRVKEAVSVLFRAIHLKKFGIKVVEPPCNAHAVILSAGCGYTRMTKLLTARTGLKLSGASDTGLFSVILHTFTLSLCKGAL